MLNPLAHDFTPISAFSPEVSSQQLKSTPPPKRKEEQPKKKPAKTKTTTATTNAASASSPASSSVKSKKKDSQANSKKPQQQQQHRDSKSKPRYKKTTQGTPNNATTATPSDLFAKESKFITIEAAIDPIRRIKETSHANSLQHRRQSTNNDKYQFEHGYERYIDWIDRSLRLFDTVTLVGMDNAVVDIVSLVTILQDRRIGVHDDVETFSMDTGKNRITACIQVKLHTFY